MKSKILSIALFTTLFIYTSCSKISENVQRDIIFSDMVSFDIPVLTSTTTSSTISPIQISFNLQEQIDARLKNFTVDNIRSVKITSLNMTLLPLPVKDSIDAKNNFGNLETIKFGIATGDKTDNIASATIPAGTRISSLALPTSIHPETLKTYLNASSKNYNVIVKAKTVTTTIMKVKAKAVYTITLSK